MFVLLVAGQQVFRTRRRYAAKWALQVQLRGQADYLHKLVAASHIYDIWTAKGSDAAALADRS